MVWARTCPTWSRSWAPSSPSHLSWWSGHGRSSRPDRVSGSEENWSVLASPPSRPGHTHNLCPQLLLSKILSDNPAKSWETYRLHSIDTQYSCNLCYRHLRQSWGDWNTFYFVKNGKRLVAMIVGVGVVGVGIGINLMLVGYQCWPSGERETESPVSVWAVTGEI